MSRNGLRRRFGRANRVVLILGVLALGVLDSASGDSANSTGTGPAPPSVFISAPEDRSMVRSASFEITGGLGGSVTTIEVFADGASLGPGRRVQDEPDRWRLPASEVSLTQGLHRISVTATGEGGRGSAGSWVFLDPNLPFEIAVDPTEASYEPGEFDSDPDLLLLGDDVPLDLTVTAPEGISASTNARLTTGSLAKLSVNVLTEDPGVYPITVRATGPDGTERTATHTITIIGPAPTTSITTPSTTAATGTSRVLFDDFEGPDQWTATITGTTNGSDATAELAGGGNPGTMRRMVHNMPGTDDGDNNPTQISVLHLFTGGEWDPSTDGVLTRLNYSEDQIEFEPPFDGAAIGAIFVIVQNGTTFVAFINENNAYSNTTWQTTRVDDLTPADFLPAPGPDFSATGGPMQFGYQRSNTSRGGGDGIVLQHGIDNWTVELFGG